MGGRVSSWPPKLVGRFANLFWVDVPNTELGAGVKFAFEIQNFCKWPHQSFKNFFGWKKADKELTSEDYRGLTKKVELGSVIWLSIFSKPNRTRQFRQPAYLGTHGTLHYLFAQHFCDHFVVLAFSSFLSSACCLTSNAPNPTASAVLQQLVTAAFISSLLFWEFSCLSPTFWAVHICWWYVVNMQ